MTQRSKVAILGTGQSLVAAPFGDPSFAKWTQNGAWSAALQADVHFEMHDYEGEQGFAAVYGPEYVAWLKARTNPTYMLEARPWVPSSRRFPIESMTEQFGEVWASTLCYMLALAITKGCSEIALCGIEMHGKQEYLQEREWVQQLRGQALGRAVKVTFPGGSALEKRSTRYGYDGAGVPDAVFAVVQREQALAKLRRDHAEVELQRAEGARLAYEGLRKRCPPGELLDVLVKAEAAATLRRDKAMAQRIESEGALASAERSERALELVAVGGAA